MTHKFTPDGRKVAIIGALNAKETIVQEIFVADGTEFPAGEHFVVKTLLDAPAETYKTKKERETEESIKRLEKERDSLHDKIKSFRFRASAAAAKIKWVEGITEPEVAMVVDNIKAMICGEYTHVVILGHSRIEIEEWDEKIFTLCDDYNKDRFRNLRMVSLFGNWNGRLDLGWKVNSYSDGSGSSATFFPCRSFTEAIEKAKEIIYSKAHLSDSDYQFCLTHGITVDEEKNLARIQGKRASKEKEITRTKEILAQQESELAEIRTPPICNHGDDPR